jgi:hypothetical protein
MVFNNEIQDFLDSILVAYGIDGYDVEVEDHPNYLYYCQIQNSKKGVILELSNDKSFTAHLYEFTKRSLHLPDRFIPIGNLRSSEYDVMDILIKVDKWLGDKNEWTY